jgi:transcriptional regulator with XRE-family HTH domain
MADPPAPSEESLALALMRTQRGWGQKQLAAAAGLEPDTISAYERRRSPAPATLYHFAALMGFPPSFVTRTLAYVAAGREWLQPADAVGIDAARRDIELLAADQARRYEEFLLRQLAWCDRATEALLERREAPRLWRRLRRHPPKRRPAVVEAGEDFWSWGLVELLCEESVGEAARDPGAAEDLARLALAAARRVPGEEAWRERVCGYATAFVGNAQRVQGHLRAADATFAEAKQLWHAGSAADPGLIDASRPLALEAALRRDQRRSRDSLTLLEHALAEARSDRSIGRVLLNKANAFASLGACDRAVATLRQAAPHLERAGDARLLFGLRFNLLENEFQAGYPVDIPTRLAEIQSLADRQGNAIDRVRVRWLEGRLAAGMGRRAEAEKAFLEVRDAFVARKMPYDTALVLLELAVLILEENRQKEVRDLAAWVEPIFRAEGVHREALAALCLFHQAALDETATAELALVVLNYLRRSRHDASVRFHAFGRQGPESGATEDLLPPPTV